MVEAPDVLRVRCGRVWDALIRQLLVSARTECNHLRSEEGLVRREDVIDVAGVHQSDAIGHVAPRERSHEVEAARRLVGHERRAAGVVPLLVRTSAAALTRADVANVDRPGRGMTDVRDERCADHRAPRRALRVSDALVRRADRGRIPVALFVATPQFGQVTDRINEVILTDGRPSLQLIERRSQHGDARTPRLEEQLDVCVRGHLEDGLAPEDVRVDGLTDVPAVADDVLLVHIRFVRHQR